MENENEKHPFDQFFSSYQADQLETITVKEAALELNLSESTIYNYVKDGILQEKNSELLNDKIRITKASVQQLSNNAKEHLGESGISLNLFAKRMNITKSRLQQLIEAHDIPIQKIKHGKREQYYITNEIQETIYNILLQSEHFPKTPFFNSRKNIALYQAFTSKVNHNTYRIERIDNVWGIRTPTGILPFEIAESRYELIPNYSLRQRIRNAHNSVTIRLGLQHEHFYALIDTLYATFGIDNLQFQYASDQELLVFVKATTYKLQTQQEQILFINNYLEGGSVTVEGQNISVKSFDSTFTVTISYEQIQTLTKLARESNLTEKKYLEALIKNHLINESQ